MGNWPEQLMLSVNQKIYIKDGLEHTVVCHFPMLENAHLGPEFTKLHLAAGLRQDPLGELTALSQTP